MSATTTDPAHARGDVDDGHDRNVVFLIFLHIEIGREDQFLRVLTPVLDAIASRANVCECHAASQPGCFMLYETMLNEIGAILTT